MINPWILLDVLMMDPHPSISNACGLVIQEEENITLSASRSSYPIQEVPL